MLSISDTALLFEGSQATPVPGNVQDKEGNEGWGIQREALHLLLLREESKTLML
jgi:hypothetical protein